MENKPLSRNKTFKPDQKPLNRTGTLGIKEDTIHGPSSFLNPTQAHFDPYNSENCTITTEPATGAEVSKSTEEPAASRIVFKWTSRNNRKGRYALIFHQNEQDVDRYIVPPPTNNVREVFKVFSRMFTYFPVWDISYLVAIAFTVGSLVFITNGFFVLLPFTNPQTDFPGEVLYGGGITAFIGATIFQIGAILLLLETINADRVGSFGWALEHLHPHTRILSNTPTTATTKGKESWTWLPSSQDLRAHYSHDIAFIASTTLLLGTTAFWISGVTSLPGIYTSLTTPAELIGAYWSMQVVGGICFVSSGALFTLETQRFWWRPAPGTLGWHTGVWSLVGGIGFFLCSIFGLLAGREAWAALQATCCTFWGSWAFLIASVIQWYECLNKYPVEAVKHN